MALTSEGAKITDTHRRRQVALAVTADSQMRRLWDSTLDMRDLDRTQPIWKKAMIGLLEQWWKVSADTAAQYLPRFRQAEIGDGSIEVGVPRFDRAKAGRRLEWGGMVNVLWHIAMGQTREAAYAAARELFIGMFHESVLTGGRLTLQQWAAKDSRAIGWRRVSDGHPCAFCAMLVGRGPVYTSEQKALRRQSDGQKFHPHCGCTIELVYGGDWRPDRREQQWVDDYYRAAESLPEGTSRTADRILPIMRRTGDYHDSASYRGTDEYRRHASEVRAERRRKILEKRRTDLAKTLDGPANPMNINESDRGTANPGFGKGVYGRRNNCQSCVVAYELRRRGFDVEARARTSVYQDKVAHHMNIPWKDPITGNPPKTVIVGSPSRSAVADRIERHVAIGQRWCMHYGYANQKEYGHIVVIERPSSKTNGGSAIVVDPQSGRIATLREYLSEDIIDIRSVRIFRVDNQRLDREHAHEIIKPKAEQ